MSFRSSQRELNSFMSHGERLANNEEKNRKVPFQWLSPLKNVVMFVVKLEQTLLGDEAWLLFREPARESQFAGFTKKGTELKKSHICEARIRANSGGMFMVWGFESLHRHNPSLQAT